jgi:hypothetical protein
MSLAFFRITQVDGQATSTGPDPFIDVGYYSNGQVGTARYANEPVHLIAAPRKNGYPGMRWIMLETSRLRIGAILHTETFDLMITSGQLVHCKVVDPGGVRLYTVSINVQGATSAAGGSLWYALDRAQVTREADDPGLLSDLWHMRGRKLARRAGSWLWDQFFE